MSYLEEFRERFSLASHTDLSDVEVAVEATYAASAAADEFLMHVTPPSNADGFRIFSFNNLLARTFEHVQGMLVAMTTGSPASAEALGRIVVESSVNLIFLAKRGDAATLVRFYRSWLDEHGKRLNQWTQLVQADGADAHLLAQIDERRKIIPLLTKFLDEHELRDPIDMTSPAVWVGQVLQRFQAVGMAEDYYTTYHRLSGASHITPEDTLNWLLSWSFPADVQKRMGVEAWAYSLMMTRLVCRFFIDAVSACCEAYGMPPSSKLAAHRRALDVAVVSIAADAGVPMVNGARS